MILSPGVRGADVERKTFSIRRALSQGCRKGCRERIEDIIDEIRRPPRKQAQANAAAKKVFEIHPRARLGQGQRRRMAARKYAAGRQGGNRWRSISATISLTEDVFGVLSDTGLCFLLCAATGERRSRIMPLRTPTISAGS